jgi:hypothetical protein
MDRNNWGDGFYQGPYSWKVAFARALDLAGNVRLDTDGI